MKNYILFIVCIFAFSQCFSQRDFAKRDAGSSGGADNMYDLYLGTIDIDQKSQSFGLTDFNWYGGR